MNFFDRTLFAWTRRTARLMYIVGLTGITAPALSATYTVVNTNDTGVGSLRWALTSAMTSSPPRAVHFNIPGPGPHTIKVGNMLPTLTNAVSILGNTQPGYTGTPVVTILGPTSDFLDYGLNISAGASEVRGLRFSGFTQLDYGAGIAMYVGQVAECVLDGNYNGIIAQGGTVGGTTVTDRNIIINNENGIWMVTGSTAVVRGNFIGVQADGVTPAGNNNGIRTFYTSGRTIEGHPNYPQVISGNTSAGILLGPNGGYVFFSSGNTIRGNYIGTDSTGMIPVPNNIGVHIWGGGGNIIGGSSANQRNIIAGNLGAGVLVDGIVAGIDLFTINNQIIGNYIGLAADGETVLSNYYGVRIFQGINNKIGGTSEGQGNRFGRATFYNVLIDANTAFCYSNSVQGNWFGLSVSTQVVAAGPAGVRIGNASNNLVGGTSPGAANHFAGVNTAVSLEGDRARDNRVIGNFIGVTPSGEVKPVNTYGIHIFNAPRNQIGGVYTNEGNVISGCQWYGVFIERTGSFANVVQGNRIGTDPTATFSVSNRYAGVDIAGGAFSNIVGGTDYSRANVIAGNGGAGVSIRDVETRANEVRNNYIGMTTGFVAIGNSGSGVSIFNATTNLIGPNNYIGNSLNGGSGIFVSGTNAAGNIIFSNVIGMDAAANRHPNYYGIDVLDALNTQIGLPVFLGGNFISGNLQDGVRIRGLARNTRVQVNYIGTDFSRTMAVTNGGSGINVDAYDTIIGGPDGFNQISGNALNGIHVNGGAGTVIQGNYVGLNFNGTVALDNRQYGISINNATNVTVGGTGVFRNVIAASRLTGLVIGGSSSNVMVQGNYIGLNAAGSAAIPNGTTGVGVDASDVTIGGSGTLGNVISGNNSFGLEVNTGRNVRVIGNTIGLAADGATPMPNASGGVRLRGGSTGVLVGGISDAEANVIARNGSTSEFAIDGPSSGHHILGNFIGVKRFGVTFTNHDVGRGLFINNSTSNRIAGNILGQLGEALYISGTGSFANVIQGNFIGEYNLEPVTNSGWGIVITNARNNVVGGFTAEERNLITRNNGGILITGTNAINNDVARNLIFGNSSRLNIDLGPLGFNTDDVNDADEGPNRLQNRPRVVSGVTLSSPTPLVYAQGVLTSAPSTTYAIDLFRSQGTNASAFRYIGRTFATTDGSGVGSFTAGFAFNLAAGEFLSATATDPEGNTSEFGVSPAGVTGATNLDTDGDGIPDYWETLYGLNPAASNAPDSDVDNDGFSDLEEYLADTHPNHPDAYPVIIAFENTTQREVTFPSSGARVYSLHANDALVTSDWFQVGAAVPGLFGFTTLTDTNLPDHRNYRMSVRLP
ncbi:MAG TPA: hypothetical protein PKE26_10275 [Kiritimatiellia bacterium]|nr:hypothetical protein [Kiritimatiellia bacterium]HMO99484.1 hypothetical protein [Kiritimatiellia bacterium]HMP97526.1 hypothetical protein [Kiritimatiellia bacterium]